MNTLQNIITIPEKYFTVDKKEINNSKALLPNVLYNQMELFAKTIISENTNIANSTPQLLKLQILKNAYLNDRLHIKAKIKTLNKSELNLLVVVKKKNISKNSTICKAIFKFPLKQNISKAS